MDNITHYKLPINYIKIDPQSVIVLWVFLFIPPVNS